MTKEEALEVINIVEGVLTAAGHLNSARVNEINMAKTFAQQDLMSAAIERLHKISNELMESRIQAGTFTHRQAILSRLQLVLGLI